VNPTKKSIQMELYFVTLTMRMAKYMAINWITIAR